MLLNTHMGAMQRPLSNMALVLERHLPPILPKALSQVLEVEHTLCHYDNNIICKLSMQCFIKISFKKKFFVIHPPNCLDFVLQLRLYKC